MSLGAPKIPQPKLPYVGPVASYERDRATQSVSALTSAGTNVPLNTATQRQGGRPSLLGGI